ncbi:MAG: PAS domain S-box protein [Nitrosomonadales bacterium]|nr:PAS domain S-box protein [Nitrosomonadales bacterium]
MTSPQMGGDAFSAPTGDRAQAAVPRREECFSEEERAALLFMLEDLERSRKQIEQAHQEWIAAMDAIRDPIFMHDKDYRILRSNRAYAERAGMSVKEVLGKLYYEVFPRRDGALSHCCHSMREEKEEEEILIASGEFFVSRSFPVYGKDGGYLYSLHVMEDITERRRMQHALQENEEKFRQICATAQDAILMMDNVGRITYWNRAAEKIFGYAAEEAIGRELHTLIVPERFRKDFAEKFPAFTATGEGAVIGKTVELAAIRKNGAEFPVDLSVSAARLVGQWHAVGFIRDITEHKQAAHALLNLNRAFRTLSAGNHELVHADDEAQLLQAMCRVVVETGGYSAAWVGYKQHDAEKSLRPMAYCGFDAGFADILRITWADSERGQGPSGKAVRNGMTQVVQDVAGDPACAPWHGQAVQRGYASAIALPLRNGSEVFGNLSIYAAEADAFNREEITLLEEMAGDLAFGIRTLRLRQEQQRGAEQVRKGLEGTVQAIAAMVELRDPYTAGHQRRVAQLAAAIAVELGLPEERVRGIHLAGTIHDLGKIQTPAEILSKPGKLSATEFNLIKDHPQNGYEILKGIAFPWPIAQMVWQHHEKLDGSGYPQGLKGEEILLEARILSVADVVEAMSSHRPYRPGLGTDAAMAEIGRGRGGRYDPDAVDACVRLFREKGYEL